MCGASVSFESLGHSIWSPCFSRKLHFELSLLSSVSQCRRQRERERDGGVLGLPCHFLHHIPGPLQTLTYQKQDGFLYCHPFHLKCKWILPRCGLAEIKAGVLTFSGAFPSPLSLVFWGRGPGGGRRGRSDAIVLLSSSGVLQFPLFGRRLSLALCSQYVHWCRWPGVRHMFRAV